MAGSANDALALTLIGQGLTVFTSGCAIVAMNYWGRRPLFIGGEIAAAICLILLAIVCTITQTTQVGQNNGCVLDPVQSNILLYYWARLMDKRI